MEDYICNPIFPLNEYVPDGEPHVFGDRVYLYGSHDAAGSERFCVENYTIWSAPVDNLTDWTNHGITYKKTQDPRSTPVKSVDFYAPDCVVGNDGRYYLYYFSAGPNTTPFGPLSAAVSDCPCGPFEYLGDVRYPDGKTVLRYLTNDPAVLNDNGRIYLYYGWGLGRDFRSKILQPLYRFVLSKLTHRSYAEVKNTKPSILSCAVTELEDDMLTVKYEPKAVLDSKTTAAKGSELYNHPFYEAPSVRKFGNLYYLVYSSGENNELAYATSEYPDRDFRYRGVIVSNSDLGFNGNTVPKNNSGTIHGGIECINDKYYIFYHRCTNNTDFSRQACAEPIEIASDGTIRQVEITTQGLNAKPLMGKGTFPASICCNLITKKHIRLGLGNQQSLPRITEKNGISCLADITSGTKVVYKYFDLSNAESITVEYKGDAELSINGNKLNADNSTCLSGNCRDVITIEVTSGKADILSFTIKEK